MTLTETEPGARSTVTIRRYPNRRLYDTFQSRYVSLEEIAATVQGGTDVRVVDAKSGADVTREVLIALVTQLAEREAGSVLTPAVLHRLVRCRSIVVTPALGGALAWMLEMVLRTAEGRPLPAVLPPRVIERIREKRVDDLRGLNERVARLEEQVAALAQTLRSSNPHRG